MFKNVASQKLTVLAFADAGHASLDAGDRVTGDAANITLKIEQDDDGTQSASSDVNPTEVEDGQYRFDLTQAETNGDKLTFYPESSTAGVQVVALPSNVIYTRPQYFPDLRIASDGDLSEVNVLTNLTVAASTTLATGTHNPQSGDSYSYLTANMGTDGTGLTAVPWNASWDAEVQSECNDALVALGLDHLVSASVAGADVADNSIVAKIVSSGAIIADWDTFNNSTESLQALRDHIGDGTNLTEAGGTGDQFTAIPYNSAWDTSINAACDTAVADQLAVFWTSPATLVDLVWDEVITGAEHNDNNSAAKFLREASESIATTGEAQAGGASSITLAASASATDQLYQWERIRIIEGTGAGQSKLITDYNGTTKVATVNSAWAVQPVNGSVYSITGADVVVDAVDNQLVTASATVNFDDLATIETVTSAIPDSGAMTSIAQASALATAQTDLDTITGTAGALIDVGTSAGQVQISSGVVQSNAVQINSNAAAASNLQKSASTIVQGAAQTGTLSTTQMSTDLSETTADHYNGRIIIWTSGALANQATDITDYDGAGLLTFTAVTEAPSDGDTFVIV